MKKIGVLICDDSALMRMTLKRIIESRRQLFVSGFARDGRDAVEKARKLRPDIITMDINMPEMDGLTALQIIVNEGIAPVIMVSSLTQEGAATTFEALELGAFDYVAKPGGTVSANMSCVANELTGKIKAAARYDPKIKLKRQLSRKNKVPLSRGRITKRKVLSKKRNVQGNIAFKAVAIGISTGGPKTILEVLPQLPGDLPAAIFLVQHMPPNFTSSFAERIDEHSSLKCHEVQPGMLVEPGHIYLGKGGLHLTLFKKSNNDVVIRTPRRPELLFKPSVDVMMGAVVDVFGQHTIGVLMTGMGKDGVDGMEKIASAGGVTIAESEESAIVFGMPREAIEKGIVQTVAPSWNIAGEVVRAVNGG